MLGFKTKLTVLIKLNSTRHCVRRFYQLAICIATSTQYFDGFTENIREYLDVYSVLYIYNCRHICGAYTFGKYPELGWKQPFGYTRKYKHTLNSLNPYPHILRYKNTKRVYSSYKHMFMTSEKVSTLICRVLCFVYMWHRLHEWDLA